MSARVYVHPVTHWGEPPPADSPEWTEIGTCEPEGIRYVEGNMVEHLQPEVLIELRLGDEYEGPIQAGAVEEYVSRVSRSLSFRLDHARQQMRGQMQPVVQQVARALRDLGASWQLSSAHMQRVLIAAGIPADTIRAAIDQQTADQINAAVRGGDIISRREAEAAAHAQLSHYARNWFATPVLTWADEHGEPLYGSADGWPLDENGEPQWLDLGAPEREAATMGTLHDIDEALEEYDNRTIYDTGGSSDGSEEWPYASF
jgi:hypothetical protein